MEDKKLNIPLILLHSRLTKQKDVCFSYQPLVVSISARGCHNLGKYGHPYLLDKQKMLPITIAQVCFRFRL